MVYGLCGLTSAPIDSPDLVAHVTVVILLGELCRRTVGRATNLGADLVFLLIWPLMAQLTNLNMEPTKLLIDVQSSRSIAVSIEVRVGFADQVLNRRAISIGHRFICQRESP